MVAVGPPLPALCFASLLALVLCLFLFLGLGVSLSLFLYLLNSPGLSSKDSKPQRSKPLKSLTPKVPEP